MFTNYKAFNAQYVDASYKGTDYFWGWVDHVIKDEMVRHIYAVVDGGQLIHEGKLQGAILLTQIASACVAAKRDKEDKFEHRKVKLFTPFFGDKTVDELIELLKLWKFLD